MGVNMTRKDYIKIAQAISETKNANNEINSYELEGTLVNIFLADNPRFDAERFFQACKKENV